MRLLHTSDWHLGRQLYNTRLLDDQAHALDQVVEMVRDSRPDAVLIAGDVFDRAVPPPDAVRLLDDVLGRIVLGAKVPVVMIAGNHDSADRLGFGARLLASQGLHVFGRPALDREPLVLADGYGDVEIHPLPYADPLQVAALAGEDGIDGHDQALRRLLAARRPDPSRRAVAVGHAFVAGGAVAESERALSVGGSGQVDADCFAGFHAVALGHLHRPQLVGDGRISYSGSLLKYSLSEVDHDKSATLIELDGAGAATFHRLGLSPRRDLRRIEDRFADIAAAAAADPRRDDYLVAGLTDDGLVVDAMARLREVYPNTLHVYWAGRETAGEGGSPAEDRCAMAPLELIGEFMRHVSGTPLSEAQQAVAARLIAGLFSADREVV